MSAAPRLDEVLSRPDVSRLRELIEDVPHVVMVISDLDTTMTWTCQAGVTNVLGYTVDDYVGRKRHTFVHPDDRKIAMAGFRRAVGGDSAAYMVRDRTADGNYQLVSTIVWRSDGPTGPAVLSLTLLVATDPETVRYLHDLAAQASRPVDV